MYDAAAPSAKLLALVQRCSIPYAEVPLAEQLENVREHLRVEVDKRLRATAPKTPMVKRTCSECAQPFEISERRAKEQTRCDDCRFPLRFVPTGRRSSRQRSEKPSRRCSRRSEPRQRELDPEPGVSIPADGGRGHLRRTARARC